MEKLIDFFNKSDISEPMMEFSKNRSQDSGYFALEIEKIKKKHYPIPN